MSLNSIGGFVSQSNLLRYFPFLGINKSFFNDWIPRCYSELCYDDSCKSRSNYWTGTLQNQKIVSTGIQKWGIHEDLVSRSSGDKHIEKFSKPDPEFSGNSFMSNLNVDNSQYTMVLSSLKSGF